MAHVTTLEIDGTTVPIGVFTPRPRRLSLLLEGVSTLTLSRRVIDTSAADPYLGKPVVLKIDGTTFFAGDVVDRAPGYGPDGWIIQYQCRCLRARAERAPFVDSQSLTSQARYNLDPADPDRIDARQGRNVGAILYDALTMTANATALNVMGIGGYTSMSPPTLPADTLADLAAMTTIPPQEVAIGGDSMAQAIVGFVRQWAPNHDVWFRPDGVIRFLDRRNVVENILTHGDCSGRVEPSGLSRSVAECRQRVEGHGSPMALPFLLTTADGSLEEFFAWGTYSNADAKTHWTTDDYYHDANALNVGTCSCTDTTHVVVTSAGATWNADEWDQTHRRGVVYLSASTGSGLTLRFASRIVANTAKVSAGTATLTLETPLPNLTYDGYQLCGFASGASWVYRLYRAADPLIRAALARRFAYAVPFVNSTGTSARLIDAPEASCVFDNGGATAESPMGIIQIDPSAGTFLFDKPTWIVAGDKAPAEVRVLAAVNVDALVVTAPSSGYAGTSHTVDGQQNTLRLALDSWRDPGNRANVQAYVNDVLDSVKDAMIDGSVTVHDLYVPGLTFGNGLSVTGASWSTGWEGLNAPVVETDVTWNDGGPTSYTTSMRVSNRRASFSLSAYLQPQRAMDHGVQSGEVRMLGAPVAATDSGYGGSGDTSGVDADIAAATGLDRGMDGANVSGRYGGRGRSNLAEREARKASQRRQAKADREGRSESIAAKNHADGEGPMGPPSPFPNRDNAEPKTNFAKRQAGKDAAKQAAIDKRRAKDQRLRNRDADSAIRHADVIGDVDPSNLDDGAA